MAQAKSITIVVRTQGKRESSISLLTESFIKLTVQNPTTDISLLFVTDSPEFQMMRLPKKTAIRYIPGAPTGDTRCFLLWSSFNLINSDYAIFLDDDDSIAERDWTELAVTLGIDQPDLVFLPVNLVMNTERKEQVTTSNRLVALSLGTRNFVPISGVLYSSAVLRAMPIQRLISFGPFFAEDHILMRMAIRASQSIAFCRVDAAVVNIRSNLKPLSSSEVYLWKRHDLAMQEVTDLISGPGSNIQRMRIFIRCAVPLGLYVFSILNLETFSIVMKLKRQSWRAQ